jgi:hypothetical protein
MGKIARDLYVTDGTIPRGKVPEILRQIDDLSRTHGLGYANCFHAEDGNLHPMILFDAAKAGDLAKAEAFGADTHAWWRHGYTAESLGRVPIKQDAMMVDRILSHSGFSHIVDVPIERIDIADCLFNTPEAE